MRVHFIGAGGSGMSGLALLTRSFGHEVSGCDRCRTPYLEMLAKQGVPVSVGHDPAHLDHADILVRSSAVKGEEEEVRVAREVCRIPVVTRGELLAKMLENRTVIGVAGAHGKSSTTWLIWHILRRFGVGASLYAGAKSEGVNAVAGGDPWVVELDESDGSVFLVRPRVFVLTNLELEHVDYYRDADDMLRRFRVHLNLLGHRRFVIGRGFALSDTLYADFGGLTFPTREELSSKREIAGGPQCRFLGEEGCWVLDFRGARSTLGDSAEPFHIIQNRAAALLAAYTFLRLVGREIEPVPASFWGTLPSIDRRFEKKGKWRDMALVDDYAHHPSEVRALMEQAERAYGRYILVFQPHRSSRFERFFDEFAKILAKAPGRGLLRVFLGGEPEGEKNNFDLERELKKRGMNVVHACQNLGEAAVLLSSGRFEWARAVVTAGAGDVNDIFALLEGR